MYNEAFNVEIRTGQLNTTPAGQDIVNHIRTDNITQDDLSAISQAVFVRRKTLGAIAYDDFNIGNRVMITGAGTGAKYLNGKKGTIIKKLYVKFEVEMDEGQDLKRFGKIIRVPPSMLRPID